MRTAQRDRPYPQQNKAYDDLDFNGRIGGWFLRDVGLGVVHGGGARAARARGWMPEVGCRGGQIEECMANEIPFSSVPVTPLPMEVEIAKHRYGFEQLRVRLGSAGKPISVRQARRLCQKIDRIKGGSGWIYTEEAVLRFEAKRTLRAA